VAKFSATTPIYYVNAKPHLGHAYTTIIADAVSRWHRLLGDDVHLLTGTDEHGLKIARAAEEAGVTPQRFVDDVAPLFADAWKRLNVRYEDFIRTTEERHKIGVQRLLEACYAAGDIEKDVYRGHYCVACEAYYIESEIEGGNCPIHKRPVEFVEEENWFFRLSRFEDRLLEWYERHPDAITPTFRRNEVIGFIKGGLADFSISRRTLTWGAVGGWLLVGGEKMSKTTGNVVNPLDLIDDVGVDGFRYYVLADTVYGNDGDFTYEGLIGRFNSDLANNLGNLAARIATVVEKKCDGLGPAPRADSPLAEIAKQTVADADAAWRSVQPSRALEATWNLIRATNAHLERNEPWKMSPGPDVDVVMGDAIEALRIVTILANPALPTTTQEIWRRLGLSGNIEDRRVGPDTTWGGYPAGLRVDKGEPLFPSKKD